MTHLLLGSDEINLWYEGVTDEGLTHREDAFSLLPTLDVFTVTMCVVV